MPKNQIRIKIASKKSGSGDCSPENRAPDNPTADHRCPALQGWASARSPQAALPPPAGLTPLTSPGARRAARVLGQPSSCGWRTPRSPAGPPAGRVPGSGRRRSRDAEVGPATAAGWLESRLRHRPPGIPAPPSPPTLDPAAAAAATEG